MVSWNRIAPAGGEAGVVPGDRIRDGGRRDGPAGDPGRAVDLGSRAAGRPSPPGPKARRGADDLRGGRLPEEIRDTFIELAGGREARIVVIPTAHAMADSAGSEWALNPWKAKGVASLVRFHTARGTRPTTRSSAGRSRTPPGSGSAAGSRLALTSAYLGTEVERQLKAVLDRGGVIGGTSAGAAVMTRVMIASGRTEAVLSRGFDLLPGAVVDQHFLKRNRARRLLGVVASHRDLIGFGIDEGRPSSSRPGPVACGSWAIPTSSPARPTARPAGPASTSSRPATRPTSADSGGRTA